MAMAIPFIAMAASAAGSVQQGNAQASALNQNAATYEAEGRTAAAQGYEQEAQQRRTTGMQLGQERAALAQSGTGNTGSNAAYIRQNAANAELDALNIRYKSQLQKWAYMTQSGNLQSEAGVAQTSGYMKAGAALLRGFSSSY